MTVGARQVDHHLQLTDQPMEINMLDEAGEYSASAGTADVRESQSMQELQEEK